MEIDINASRKYKVTVTDNFIGLEQTIEKIAKGKNIAIVTDNNVQKLYLDSVLKVIPKKYCLTTITLPSGESTKSIKYYSLVLEKLAESGFTREDTILALGGGVIGDLTAFVASTYMRGIKLIAIPTTLLSMIDSSVGGKTAINLAVGKNLCGSFYQPSAVYINVNTLDTLADSEIINGKGELVKYAILDDRLLFSDIENYKSIRVIAKCVEIKKEIVEQDEFESRKRMLLNLGHTIGHGVEALSGYKLGHGLCVLKGLKATAEISYKLGLIDNGVKDKIISLISSVTSDLELIYNADDIIKEISVDKKAVSGGVNFVVICKIGNCVIKKISLEDLRGLLID